MDFSFLKKSLTDFAQAAKEKADQLEAKKLELSELTKLPLPRADLISGIHTMLDAQAARYPEKLAMTLAGVIANPSFDFANSQLDLVSNSGGCSQPGTLPKQNALWFFGGLIKNRMTDAIMTMPYPKKTGLPLSERQPLIAKLTKEIAQLESEAAELRQQASSLGINIPAPMTTREEKISLTKEVMRLTTVTPFPDHAIRQMLIDGIDPLQEMQKIQHDKGATG